LISALLIISNVIDQFDTFIADRMCAAAIDFCTMNQALHDLPDVICFSHLRWDFVYQRPQHLLSRFAKETRVFFIEEPISEGDSAYMDVSRRTDKLFVVVPHIPVLANGDAFGYLRSLLNSLLGEQGITNYISWYYTPQMLPWSRDLKPSAIVYDCMDELSAFKFAPRELLRNESELLSIADLVFTGGQSLYEAKRDRHPRVFAFPSSIDKEHFAQARSITDEPEDQTSIPHPRLGFCGVIDERLDTELLAKAAELRPEWHFVLVGPVVKIAEEDLPRAENIHYLGGKNYADLPKYLAGWDVAIMPFAMNESTRFISPTKTPEYLAAGKPVVSTPVRDVVRPYGERGLVEIASTAEEFVAAANRILLVGNSDYWLSRVDAFLAQMSWDRTFNEMKSLIDKQVVAGPPGVFSKAV
jgi:UDP-galactopyranose mutase